MGKGDPTVVRQTNAVSTSASHRLAVEREIVYPGPDKSALYLDRTLLPPSPHPLTSYHRSNGDISTSTWSNEGSCFDVFVCS